MTAPAQTLEGQLDALIAEHGLDSITMTRLIRVDGTGFWAVYAQGDNATGSHCGGEMPANTAIASALADLNEKRTRPVNVPELAPMEQESKPFPQPQRRDGKEPCGECRLPVGEVCDICGASTPAAASIAWLKQSPHFHAGDIA